LRCHLANGFETFATRDYGDKMIFCEYRAFFGKIAIQPHMVLPPGE